MNQIQEMYQHGILAQQNNGFGFNNSFLVKSLEKSNPSELENKSLTTPNLETMPELKIEACLEETKPANIVPVKLNEPDNSRNLLFNLINKSSS